MTANEIHKLIIDGDTGSALEQMYEVVKNTNYESDIILLLSRFNSLRRDQREGIISNENLKIERARISNAAVEVLKDIEKAGKIARGPEIPLTKGKDTQETTTNKNEGKKPKVFISYSRKDTEWMERIKKALEEENIKAIIDEEVLHPGDNIESVLKELIKDTDFTVSVISENSLLSPWVSSESHQNFMYEFVNRSKKLLPVVIDATVTDIEFSIKAYDSISDERAKVEKVRKSLTERGESTQHLNPKIKRIENQRKQLDTILERISENLWLDFTDEEMFKKNFPKLIRAISRDRDNS